MGKGSYVGSFLLGVCFSFLENGRFVLSDEK